jgi:bifunctional DNA-binding transcriptional regulator/antitoxin component of YhaV-PrlF toxin-antitoxin module
MRITKRGQITIPANIRARAGMTPNIEVTCEYDGTAARLLPVTAPHKPGQGTELVAHLRHHGKRHGTMTTDEIMALTRGE